MIKLKEGEELIREIRRHWFVMFGSVLGSVFLALIPVVLISALLAFSVDIFQFLDFEGHSIASLLALYCLWLLLIMVFLTVRWTVYYLDVWYITSYRIVAVEQFGLFMRKTKTLNLDRVQDITVEVKGFIPTMFDFGTVHVQSAGASRRIDLDHSREPYEIKKTLLKAMNEGTAQR